LKALAGQEILVGKTLEGYAISEKDPYNPEMETDVHETVKA
jgi:hypothetical protein